MPDPLAGHGALICIPTYNERENIERIVPAAIAAAPEANVLVIDDNSPDGTGELADALAREDDRIHVLHRAGKEGLGRAYLAGFKWALARDYSRIIEFDADFSHDPRYLPTMLSTLERADVGIGSRRVPGGGVENWGAVRRFVSWGGSVYARTVLGVSIKDLTGGFNGFRREALEAIDLGSIETRGYGFQIELKYRCVRHGLWVEEFPIVFPDRTLGTSKMSNAIFIEAMVSVGRLRFGRGVAGRPSSPKDT